jgi:hypothetical protein
MDAAHDLADLVGLAQLVIGGAQGVVEYLDARSAGLGLHQRLHLRVINPVHFILVEEIDDSGMVMDKAEPVALQHEIVGLEPAVMQRDPATL